MSLVLRQARYRYPAASDWTVDVSLDVRPGEVVLLTGPTGSGKSTVLRLAAGLLQRHGHGDADGQVLVSGRDPARTPPAERASLLGFVGQEPHDQLVAGLVGDEVAFGPESAGWTAERIAARLPEVLAAVGLDVGLERSVRALSGGQTQRLVVAAARAAGAPVLLLDEPLAHLDPRGAAELMGRVRALADAGAAVLVVEHRLEATWEAADRVVVLDQGRVVATGNARELGEGGPLLGVCRALGLSVPELADLRDRVGGDVLAPDPLPSPDLGEVLVSGRGLRWRWGLDGVDVAVRRGERVVLLGANGAGKTTLLRALAGELRAGPVERAGRVVAVPQDPDLALFCATVGEELAYGPRESGLTRAAVGERVAAAAAALSLGELLGCAPQALSRGQRLRVAVGAALSCAPEVLLLDEPTAGQDRAQVERMLTALRDQVPALVFATHDVGLALRHATRALVLAAGRVVAEGPPAEVVAALPPDVPLAVPPLAAWCLERGLPPSTVDQLAGGA